MGVVGEFVDEVGSNAHDDDGRDEVQHMVGEDERAVQRVGAGSGRTVVICGVGASHGGVVVVAVAVADDRCKLKWMMLRVVFNWWC
jgi:uncharacterized membrane protein